MPRRNHKQKRNERGSAHTRERKIAKWERQAEQRWATPPQAEELVEQEKVSLDMSRQEPVEKEQPKPRSYEEIMKAIRDGDPRFRPGRERK